jgi:trehalose synthase-fused probable maltokinase
MEPMITIQDSWERAFDGPVLANVEALLPAFLTSSRWFGGKAKTIRSATFSDVLRTDMGEVPMVLGFVEVSYAEEGVETYTLPMTAAFEAEADRIKRDHPNAVIGALHVVHSRGDHAGVLYDALWNEDCAYSLLTAMGRRAQFRGSTGTVVGTATGLFDAIAIRPDTSPASVMKADQSNTSVKFGDRIIMKLYRRVEAGMNPELEIGRTLTARNFRHSPSLVGALEYTHERAEPTTLALAQTFIANQGNAWEYMLSRLSLYFDRVSSLHNMVSPSPATGRPIDPSMTADRFFGCIDAADLLGRRTGELHLMLGLPSPDPLFAPESCSSSYVQSRIHAMQRSATHALTLLRSRLSALPGMDQEPANMVLEQEPVILDRLGSLDRMPLTAMRIRCHGDYHLGQVLYTGQDYVIIDYEGEPARPLAERRAKHLPMVDLAGMIRSFHYAAHVALRQRNDYPSSQPAKAAFIPRAEQWYQSARAAFLRSYCAVAGKAPFSPRSQEEFNLLLNVHLLDKAMYELGYELNNRPAWIALPLTGILQCLDLCTEGGNQDVRTDDDEGRLFPCATEQPKDEVSQ